VRDLPVDVEEILELGAFCYLGTVTRHGPHVTPVVFALADGRVWVTTSRASVKARAWRSSPAVGGLVRSGDVAVSFTGHIRTFDLFDVESWARDLREAPALTAAATRFTKKNARFFAGYAVDAQHVPLSWTPPGRVFAAVEIERAAVIGRGEVLESFGVWSPGLVSLDRFRAVRTGLPTLDGLPAAVEEALGTGGEGALGVVGADGIVVLPVRWAADGAAVYGAMPEAELALAALREDRPAAALAIDRPSTWRARDMAGAMLQGTAEVYGVDGLASGGGSARNIIAEAGAEPGGTALVRMRPRQLVWWEGWSSGTVLE
jgi:hypothetical protein